MKAGWKQTIKSVVLGCLILGVFAGCGQRQGEGARYEIQNGREGEEKTESVRIESESEEMLEEVSKKGTEEETVHESSVCSQSITGKEASNATNTAPIIEYWAGETSAIVYSDSDKEESQSPGESAGDESHKEEVEMSQSKSEEIRQPYYLTAEDLEEVRLRLVHLGEGYGLTYYAEVAESETWDSPTPIYEEELRFGREYIMNTMVEYTEGAFILMQMEGCTGFALQIKEQPDTVTDAYYEVYVYWM